MLHATYHVERIAIGPRPLPLRHATLTVVARAESPELDWEVVAHTIELEPVAAASHRVSMRCITGIDDDGALSTVDLLGDVILVRAVDHALVFRGAGRLEGFDITALRG